MNKRLNEKMIALARELRGTTQMDLARAVGMSATNLSKIERGDVKLTDDLVAMIGEATHLPECFFCQEGEIEPQHLGYRKRVTVPHKILTPIHAMADVVRRHVEKLWPGVQNKYKLNLPRYAVTEKLTPGKIADKVRKDWNMSDGVVANVTRLLEDNGIVVVGMNFGTTRVDSMHIITRDGVPVIIYNKELTGDRQRFTLAFEFGQLVMHSNNKLNLDADIIHEANVFAAAFLMPAKDFLADVEANVTIPMLAKLKLKWKQSMISILYRIDDLGLITFNQKRYLVAQFNQLRIRRREPVELDAAPEEPKLMKRWIAEYRSKTKLGTADMAAVLCLRTDEFIEWYG